MSVSDQIGELLLRWEELREQGQNPSAADLCHDCPELAAELDRRMQALQAMYRVPNRADDIATLQAEGPNLFRDPKPPQLVGYELLEPLGSGGMGKVYKARHLGLKRLVALKMILTGYHATPNEWQRFRGEAEAVARLQHPNIVQIYEIGEHAGCPYLALEFVPGGSLEKKLTSTPMAPRQAAQLVRTLALAIHSAHQQNIIHRDLKPANILLAADGTPKIADFGLAKRLDEASAQTRTGSVMGTPSYMAPEQAEGRTRDIGPRTDVYALGAILYELLTGQPPFFGATLLETLEQVRSHEPMPPRTRHPDIPADLETICLKCLHKEPRDRYPSAQALADDLDRFLQGEAISARSLNLVDRLTRTLNRSPRLSEFSTIASYLIVLLAPIPFLFHLVLFLFAGSQDDYPLLAVITSLATVALMIGLYFLITGEGIRMPLTATMRNLWSVRIAQMMGLPLLALVSWNMSPADRPWDPLTVFPLWSILTGAAFFALGGSIWGRLYLIGLSLMATGVVMSLCLRWAPLLFGLMLTLTFLALSLHAHYMAKEPEDFPDATTHNSTLT
jgi:eukaryotic-like serine/threonine-protein kinase